MVTKQVVIETLFKHSRFTGEFQKVTKAMNEQAAMIAQVSNRYDSFGKAMRMPMDVMRKFGMSGGTADLLTNKGAKLAYNFRLLTHGLRGFRMEMLGVMFFGMNLARTFSSMLQPAMELVGVFDLWKNTLQQLFLPIVEALLPLIYMVTDFLNSLSKEGKLIIGFLVVFVMVLGKVLFLVGMLALGLGSLVQLFPAVAVSAGVAVAPVGGFGVAAAGASMGVNMLSLSLAVLWSMLVPILLVLAILAVLIYDIVMITKNWNNITKTISSAWANLRNWVLSIFSDIVKGTKEMPEDMAKDEEGLWDKVVEFFKGIWGTITGIFKKPDTKLEPGEENESLWNKFWGKIKGWATDAWNWLKGIDWAGIWEWIKELPGKILNFFISLPGLILGLIVSLGGWIIEKFNQWGLTTFFTNLWNGIKNIFNTTWNWIVDNIIQPLINKVDAIKEVWGTITGFFSGLWDGIKESFKTAVNFLIGLAESMANAFIDAVNWIIGALNKIQFPSFTIPLTGVVVPAFGINLSKYSNITLPRLAEGGIVTRPTMAMIGEAGPEAVVPLGKSSTAGIIINQYLSINVLDTREVEKAIEENNKNLVNDLRRLQGGF